MNLTINSDGPNLPQIVGLVQKIEGAMREQPEFRTLKETLTDQPGELFFRWDISNRELAEELQKLGKHEIGVSWSLTLGVSASRPVSCIIWILENRALIRWPFSGDQLLQINEVAKEFLQTMIRAYVNQ